MMSVWEALEQMLKLQCLY